MLTLSAYKPNPLIMRLQNKKEEGKLTPLEEATLRGLFAFPYNARGRELLERQYLSGCGLVVFSLEEKKELECLFSARNSSSLRPCAREEDNPLSVMEQIIQNNYTLTGESSQKLAGVELVGNTFFMRYAEQSDYDGLTCFVGRTIKGTYFVTIKQILFVGTPGNISHFKHYTIKLYSGGGISYEYTLDQKRCFLILNRKDSIWEDAFDYLKMPDLRNLGDIVSNVDGVAEPVDDFTKDVIEYFSRQGIDMMYDPGLNIDEV